MKVSFKFLNRWESFIFDNNSEKEFVPVSSFMAVTIIIAAFVMVITFFIITAFNNGSNADIIIAASIIFGIALLIIIGKAFRNFKVLTSIGMKVGYAAYILALSAICACFFTWLAGGFVMLLVFWAVLKSIFSDKKKGRIHYDNGTSEEATIEKGLMGETYYTGKDSGNEYKKY